jgi:hypothetical protein
MIGHLTASGENDPLLDFASYQGTFQSVSHSYYSLASVMSSAATESSRRRPNKTATESAPAATTETSEKRTRPPRVETVPVPESYVGKTFTGRISDVIRVGVPKSRPAFGFINIGPNVEPEESTPRIYFKRGDYLDPEEVHYLPRRGFEVEFTVNKSEEGKFYATGVKLTAAGREEANVNKQKADEAKAAKIVAGVIPAPTAGKAKADSRSAGRPRTRKPREHDDTTVKLLISLDGKPGTKEIDVKLGRPLGALKRDVIKEFEAEGDFIINHVTADAPAGTFLTIPIFKTLKDGDRLHFAVAPPKTA